MTYISCGKLLLIISLLMVGIFLDVLRTQIKARLWLYTGCHNCRMWQIKMNNQLVNTDYSSDYQYLVSSYSYGGVIGPLVTGWLMLAIAGYFAY